MHRDIQLPFAVILFLFQYFSVQSATLTTTWTEEKTGGKVMVTSVVSDDLKTWSYTITNLSYDPPGGDNQYGVSYFDFRGANYPIPPIIPKAVQGWTLFEGGSDWYRNSVGFQADPRDPNRPLVGILPGQTITFSFILDVSQAVFEVGKAQGSIASNSRPLGGGGLYGSYPVKGEILYPVEKPAPVIQAYAGITLKGVVGKKYRIEFTESLNEQSWLILTNLTLISSPMLIIDTSSTNVAKRFYQVTRLGE